MARHKHADLIVAWANGAEIQYREYDREYWNNVEYPSWIEDYEYRVKPEPKPDVVLYAYGEFFSCGHENSPVAYLTNAYPQIDKCNNLKLTFDGETLKLKSAEVIQ